MVAINSALQVDLTGQVCADSIGYSFYSGIGGQVDFIRGAARSKGESPLSPCHPLLKAERSAVSCLILIKVLVLLPVVVMFIMLQQNLALPISMAKTFARELQL